MRQCKRQSPAQKKFPQLQSTVCMCEYWCGTAQNALQLIVYTARQIYNLLIAMSTVVRTSIRVDRALSAFLRDHLRDIARCRVLATLSRFPPYLILCAAMCTYSPTRTASVLSVAHTLPGPAQYPPFPLAGSLRQHRDRAVIQVSGHDLQDSALPLETQHAVEAC